MKRFKSDHSEDYVKTMSKINIYTQLHVILVATKINRTFKIPLSVLYILVCRRFFFFFFFFFFFLFFFFWRGEGVNDKI